MALNKAMIIGNLGADPDVKKTPSGQSVCSISVATNEKWTDKSGEKKEHTEWHRVICWGPLAESVGQYLKKGRQVYVEGKIGTRSWDDKDGVKRYTTEITAQVVQFLGSAGEGGGARAPLPETPPGTTPATASATEPSFTEDEIPF